mgnify:CR=1 FL=1
MSAGRTVRISLRSLPGRCGRCWLTMPGQKTVKKCGGDDVRVTLYDARIADAYSELDVLDIEDAMGLEKMDQRNAQIFVCAGRISLT